MEQVKQFIRTLTSSLDRAQWLPLLLVRAALGTEFIVSGYGKLFGGLPDLIEAFESWGIPFAHIQAPFVASVELVGGVCLIVGIATRFFSMMLAGTMAVAILTLLTNEGVTSLPHDTIGDFLYLPEVGFLLLFIWLVFTGGGKASLDHIVGPALDIASGDAQVADVSS